MLSENGELIIKNQDFLTLNDYFGSIVENLSYFNGINTIAI